eukprot:400065-Amorphochlora_amoeboformis.AAC.1
MAGHQQWGAGGKGWTHFHAAIKRKFNLHTLLYTGASIGTASGDRTGFLGKLEEDKRAMAGHQEWGGDGKGLLTARYESILV